ncbi:MAG: hypothetical protein HC877_09515 [Thioploca sp.]|nr:hypothetical protein [Thioploca sp.]
MNRLSKLGNYPLTIITSNISTLFIGIALIWLAYELGADDQAYLFNWLIILLGFVIGWGIGTLLSPFNPDEKENFSGMVKAISAFISGYILAKMDKFFEVIPSRDFFQESTLERIILFLVAFFLSMIIVFINRTYFLKILERPNQSENQ